MNSNLLAALIAGGATTASVPSAFREACIAAGAADGSMATFLRQEGYTGSYADMLFRYLGDRGYTGSLADRFNAACAAEDLFDTSVFGALGLADGKHRFWWHYTDPAGLSVNTDGTGGMPSVEGSVGAILNCATGTGDDASYSLGFLPKTSGVITRKPASLQMGVTALAWCNAMDSTAGGGNDALASTFDTDAGLTVAMRVKIAVNVTAPMVFGWDFGGHRGLAVETDEKVYAGSPAAVIGGAQNWSDWRNVLITMSGGTTRLYVDDMATEVANTTGHSGLVYRWWLYNHSGGTTPYFQGLFMAAQAVSTQADRELIASYLTNGAV